MGGYRVSKPTGKGGPKNPRRRVVEVVKSSYQPSKADMEEEIDTSHLKGRTMEDLARMVTGPVAMVRTSRPPREKK